MSRFFSWLKSIFKKKPVVISHGEDDDTPTTSKGFVPQWGVIVPHTTKAQGASTPDKRMTENKYAYFMLAHTDFKYFTRDEHGVAGAARGLKRRGVNASIEPHKNAFNGKAKGFEILVLKGDTLSEHYARMIAENFIDQFPDRKLRHDRGIKWVKRGDRGAASLIAAKANGMEVALLVETFFIDNPDEWIEPEVMAKFWTENLINK